METPVNSPPRLRVRIQEVVGNVCFVLDGGEGDAVDTREAYRTGSEGVHQGLRRCDGLSCRGVIHHALGNRHQRAR